MSQKTRLVIFMYNRLFDPLIQRNFCLYMKSYLADPNASVRFHVITFEDPRHPLTEEQKVLVTEWQAQGLDWTALTWHAEMGLMQKLRDVMSGFAAVVRPRRAGHRHIAALGSVAW